MKRKKIKLLIVICILILLTSCSGHSENEKDNFLSNSGLEQKNIDGSNINSDDSEKQNTPSPVDSSLDNQSEWMMVSYTDKWDESFGDSGEEDGEYNQNGFLSSYFFCRFRWSCSDR